MATLSVETEPLLRTPHRTPEPSTSESVSPSNIPEPERAQLLGGKFRLFLALLVDAVPGEHFLRITGTKTLKKNSYFIVFASKFNPGGFDPDRSEAWP